MIFSTDLAEALELDNMLAQASVSLHSAIGRTESRGAHAREDFPKRDDKNWLKHTFCWLDDDSNVRLAYRPVHLQEMARNSPDDRVRTMAATKLLEFLPKVKEDSAGEGSFAAKLEKMSPRELREWLIGQCEDISRIEVPEGFILSPEDSARHAVVLAALTMAVHGIAAIDGRLVDCDALEAAEDGTRGYPRHRQQPPGPLAECPTAGPLNPRSDFIVVDPELVVPERSLYTTSRAPAECPPDGRSPGVSTAPAEDIPKTVVKDAAYWRERKRIQRARQKAEAAGGA